MSRPCGTSPCSPASWVAGIPVGGLLFASSFGFFWSGICEHLAWRTLEQVTGENTRETSMTKKTSGDSGSEGR